jgi:KaiC/GvpD/RAD55 family RecA-like ATPase
MSNPDPFAGEIGVSLETFISTVFAEAGPDEIVYLGPRSTKLKTLNAAERCTKEALYAAAGTFSQEARTASGWFERQSRHVVKYYVMILDDIGSKYPIPGLPGKPSYIIETSEGNYQHGYIFNRGLTAEEYQMLVLRVQALEISDPGALKLNQLIRVPAGINGKDGDTFKPHITQWDPDLIFSLTELEAEFNLSPVTKDDQRFIKNLGGFNPASEEQIEDLPILSLINSHPDTGVRLIEDGMVHIQFPNHAEHTEFTGDKETTLIIREDGSHYFSCLHGHCSGKDGFDFDKWHLNATVAALREIMKDVVVPDTSMFDRPTPAVDNPPIELIDVKLEWFEAPPKPDRFTIAGYLPRKAVTLLTATGGIGKSLLALHAAVCVATGRPFLGCAIDGGKVAYLSLEDDLDRVKGRLYYCVARADVEAVVSNMKLIDRYGKQTHVVSTEHGEVLVSSTPDEIVAAFKGRGIDLLIIDTLVRSHSVNENDNALMSTVLVAYEKLANELDCSVLLLHHVPKGNTSETAHMARGASAISDNARSGIGLIPATKKDVAGMSNVTDEMLEKELLVRVVHTKHNYSAREPDKWLLKNGAKINEFNPVFDLRAPAAQRYGELYRWWDSSFNSQPLCGTNIGNAVEAIRGEGAKHGRDTYKAALDWAHANDLAVVTTDKAGANPKATFYLLKSPE